MSEKMSFTKEQLDYFYGEVEKHGMATFPVSDGRIFMFKTDYLRRLILTANESDLKFGIRQADGTVKNVLLARDRLQSELDHTTQAHILIFLSDGPIQN